MSFVFFFFFSSRRRHTRLVSDWSSDVCSSDLARARTSALVIGGAYVAGGLIPLTPYMLMASARSALPWSALVTLTALAVFGWVKGNFAGTTPLRSALQTVLIGGLAAGAAFLIARLIA